MSVITVGGIAIGTRSGVMFSRGKSAAEALKSPADYSNVMPANDESYLGVAMWGSNNLLPQEMALDIERTGVLSATLDAKARIAMGKGPMPAKVVNVTKDGQEELEFVKDNEVLDWLEAVNYFDGAYGLTKDLYASGNPFAEILLNRNRDGIAGFKRHDFTECRFEVKNERSRRIENVIISGDWSRYASYNPKDNHYDKMPLLDRDYPLYDLQSRDKGFRFMMSLQYDLTGRQYYSPSPWYCAKKWVDISQGIPDMKAAMFKNQMNIKFVVKIHQKFWELSNPKYKTFTDDQKTEAQNKFYDKVDELLVGGENSFKSIFVPTFTDVQTGKEISTIELVAVDDKIADGKLLPDSAAANSEIMFALMMNPALIGADTPGGPYSGGAGSGSNIREAYLVQVMQGEVERRRASRIFNMQKTLAGWDKGYVLRFPNQVLTTLNEGANTKAAA